MDNVKEAFEKVKSGEWTFNDFDMWVDEQRSAAWSEGNDDGQYFASFNGCNCN